MPGWGIVTPYPVVVQMSQNESVLGGISPLRLRPKTPLFVRREAKSPVLGARTPAVHHLALLSVSCYIQYTSPSPRRRWALHLASVLHLDTRPSRSSRRCPSACVDGSPAASERYSDCWHDVYGPSADDALSHSANCSLSRHIGLWYRINMFVLMRSTSRNAYCIAAVGLSLGPGHYLNNRAFKGH